MTSKESILKEFQEHKDELISGGALSTKFNISRTAVWKAIQSLKQDGYNIISESTVGYILKGTDIFTSESILTVLKTKYPQFTSIPKITVYKVIDSTNTEAKKFATESNEQRPCVILAEEQTAGRGRLGRSFFSPAKTGIYLSILYHPKERVDEPSIITATAAVGVCRALFDIFKCSPGIKWVNDIFLGNRKVCGILTEGIADLETNTISSIIIGIGINISETEDGFPSEISNTAGSILKSLDSNRNIDFTSNIRSKLASSIIYNIISILDKKEDVIDEYKKLSIILGKQINIIKTTGEITPAVAIDIDEKAHLIAKKQDESILVLNSGEVSIRLN